MSLDWGELTKKGLVTMDNNIGYRISELRKQAGMSQFQLAKVLDIATSTLGMYETGKREPSLKVMNRIANYFNVTTDYLLGRPEKKDDDNVDYVALDKALDNARSFDGEPMDDHDREILRGILKGYFTTKK